MTTTLMNTGSLRPGTSESFWVWRRVPIDRSGYVGRAPGLLRLGLGLPRRTRNKATPLRIGTMATRSSPSIGSSTNSQPISNATTGGTAQEPTRVHE
jgi:hypothetical protein